MTQTSESIQGIRRTIWFRCAACQRYAPTEMRVDDRCSDCRPVPAPLNRVAEVPAPPRPSPSLFTAMYQD
jgi:hypothetical protein